jgi:8-oxo-dGTP pyrophosphatase MutT (NUDIX family)
MVGRRAAGVDVGGPPCGRHRPTVDPVRWTVHGERDLYDSPWVRLSLVDVEVPGGRRYEHHAVHSFDAAGVIVDDPSRGVLLLWRHRFLSDRWGWEIPGGMIEPGESPMQAAHRECVEESGWSPGPLRPLCVFSPIAGLSSQTFHAFAADSAEEVGDPAPDESERVEWISRDELRREVAANRVLDGLSVVACLHHLAFDGG